MITIMITAVSESETTSCSVSCRYKKWILWQVFRNTHELRPVSSTCLSGSPGAAGALLRDTHTEAWYTSWWTRLSQIERVWPTSTTLSAFYICLQSQFNSNLLQRG